MNLRRVSPILLGLALVACGPSLETVDPPARPVAQTPQVQQPAPVVQQAPAPATFSGGAFSARFVDKSTGAPIQGLEVTIVDTGDKRTTDASGRVSFNGLPAGAEFETYHNDFVQMKADVPAQATNAEVQVTNIKEFV